MSGAPAGNTSSRWGHPRRRGPGLVGGRDGGGAGRAVGVPRAGARPAAGRPARRRAGPPAADHGPTATAGDPRPASHCREAAGCGTTGAPSDRAERRRRAAGADPQRPRRARGRRRGPRWGGGGAGGARRARRLRLDLLPHRRDGGRPDRRRPPLRARGRRDAPRGPDPGGGRAASARSPPMGAAGSARRVARSARARRSGSGRCCSASIPGPCSKVSSISPATSSAAWHSETSGG